MLNSLVCLRSSYDALTGPWDLIVCITSHLWSACDVLYGNDLLLLLIESVSLSRWSFCFWSTTVDVHLLLLTPLWSSHSVSSVTILDDGYSIDCCTNPFATLRDVATCWLICISVCCHISLRLRGRFGRALLLRCVLNIWSWAANLIHYVSLIWAGVIFLSKVCRCWNYRILLLIQSLLIKITTWVHHCLIMLRLQHLLYHCILLFISCGGGDFRSEAASLGIWSWSWSVLIHSWCLMIETTWSWRMLKLLRCQCCCSC